MVTRLNVGPHTLVYGGGNTAFGSFDYKVTASIDVLTVPEPATYVLMLAGIGGFAWESRNKIFY
jgi:hypothetical protein